MFRGVERKGNAEGVSSRAFLRLRRLASWRSNPGRLAFEPSANREGAVKNHRLRFDSRVQPNLAVHARRRGLARPISRNWRLEIHSRIATMPCQVIASSHTVPTRPMLVFASAGRRADRDRTRPVVTPIGSVQRLRSQF